MICGAVLIWYDLTRTCTHAINPEWNTFMSDENDLFEQASSAAKALPDRPDNETLLKLYALYKQGSEGDVSGEKPGFFDFVGVAKYEAWEGLRGTSKEQAREKYVNLVRKLGGDV